MIAILLCAVAAAVILMPAIKPLSRPVAFAAAKKPPTFQTAIANLALVRLRLSDTLGEPEKKAIDTLTLALVAGSDKE